MLVTSEVNRQNRRRSVIFVGVEIVASIAFGLLWTPAFLLLLLCPFVYWFLRRRCIERLSIMEEPFPLAWEQVLESRVAYFRALADDEKERFRRLVKLFLHDVRITGVGTEIDDIVRVLVAASAVIPIFGFRDWEYHRLGEVLIYPQSFGEEYQASKKAESDILGMVGVHQLRGVMILSKPSLIAGFANASRGDNVGIHEFAHLVEVDEVENGLPPEIPWQAVSHWVKYVARELADPRNLASIRGYAYTNEHEFFAVLSEYFFKSPDLLEKKEPELYRVLEEMFHQDPAALLDKKSFRRRKDKIRTENNQNGMTR